ncbi:hypothetical protein PPL_12569 [Heterostelium album PN500]|uniref:Uncharacterized protein n=1 Tax=Heterostelium pallidum (strain ATCC 26659 / Pp 5 / PN500) TaxID=670386 RepID=D3BMZ5_HETP5|nr:hypothetical protein PPL_12569 [Heterostelium album PN500]EFA77357.1 hypothetical protein PPL_12569 [Heterostelium album PN500]|eukprot:XP_020429486.1 hypothetical protein PPL_12569 [Heterostelium album PN500]
MKITILLLILVGLFTLYVHAQWPCNTYYDIDFSTVVNGKQEKGAIYGRGCLFDADETRTYSIFPPVTSDRVPDLFMGQWNYGDFSVRNRNTSETDHLKSSYTVVWGFKPFLYNFTYNKPTTCHSRRK